MTACVIGCDNNNDDNKGVRVKAVQAEVTLGVYEVMGYDYASLFKITVDGKDVAVESAYLDRRGLSDEPGEYTVYCTYLSATASVKIIVVTEQEKPPQSAYSITLSVDSVRVNADSVDTYDFIGLFTLKINNVVTPITSDMVTSTVKSAAGEYTVTVAAGSASKTLNVVVWEHPKVEFVACYNLKEIPVNEAADFDFTELFSLYFSGKAARVTNAMLSGIPSAFNEGAEFTVTASHTDGSGNIGSATVPVKIVAAKEVAVTCKNITTYPNAEYIDLTTLFDIKYGAENIPVTVDMISGTVDYTRAGENNITLTYDGEEYTAKITVVLGVVIRHATADTIMIVRGTDKTTYPFGDDFVVTVNGRRFVDIEEFIDLSEVDFGTAGEYTAKISVPYNTEPLGWGFVDFDFFEEEITYVVTDRIAVLNVKNEFVSMPADTSVYGINQISENVSVTLNGTPCRLTVNRDWAVEITTNIFVDVINGVDVSSKGDQVVVLDVYTHGPDETPERITYTVRIASEISVVALDHALFAGDTLYARDLFEITVNGMPVDVSEAVIEGKVDTFVPGIYEVTASYAGITATAHVTVFDKNLQGTYKTPLTTIPVSSDDDDDYEDVDWDASYESMSAGTTAASRAASGTKLGDMTIDNDNIIVNGTKATNVLGMSSDVFTFSLGSNKYTMYLDNGIAVLDPDNSVKLGFTDYRRPMVYFNSALWNVDNYITINYSSTHIMQNTTTPSYSIDCFRISPKGENTAPAMWFGIKIQLVQKTSDDTVYRVTWGEVEFADSFLNAEDLLELSSSCVFLDETYNFIMETRVFGKIKKLQAQKLYANMSFTGTIDGQAALLAVNSNEYYTLNAGGALLIDTFGSDYDFSSYMVNGGPDYAESTLRLNCFGDRLGNAEDGIFSYMFKLNVEQRTFTLLERDELYGRYEIANRGMYIFLDGYGQGCISFDTKSFSRTEFSYIISGNEVKLIFRNTLPTFEYGDGMSLFVSPLLNVLTVKEAVGVPFGTTFTMLERLISDGAIVTVGDTKIAGTSGAENSIYSAVTVIDKNGEWTQAQKEQGIDIQYVGLESGFYLVTVSVSVGGAVVEQPYAFQVFEDKFSTYPIIHSYGSGAITGNGLSIDAYGRVSLSVGDMMFTGVVTQATGTSFVAKLHNSAGESLCCVAETVANGIIKLTATGSAPFSDYFSTGTNRVAGKTGRGIDGVVLREFNVSGAKTYVVANSATAMGMSVTTEVVSGNGEVGTVFKLAYADGTVKYVRVAKWGDTADGLVILDASDFE